MEFRDKGIVITGAALPFTGSISARGGPGGDAISNPSPAPIDGPGGGGGGGRVFARPLVPGTAAVAGGAYGSASPGGRAGAYPGNTGIVE